MTGLTFQSLVHFRRTNAAVIAGAAVGCAVLAGALLVGTSVRESLRELALDQLGPYGTVIETRRLVRRELADQLGVWLGPTPALVPVLRQNASAVRAVGGAVAGAVRVNGVPTEFWNDGAKAPAAVGIGVELKDDQAAINESLARELSASVGDELILNLSTYSPIPSESLLGRREGRVRKLRVHVAHVLPDRGLGRFDTRFTQAAAMNVFVDLATLQSALGQAGRINALLVADAAAPARVDAASECNSSSARAVEAALRADLSGIALPTDLGLRIRTGEPDRALGNAPGAAIESESLVLPHGMEDAIVAAAAEAKIPAQRVLTYLANSIRKHAAPPGSPEVPYSVIAATDIPVIAASDTLATMPADTPKSADAADFSRRGAEAGTLMLSSGAVANGDVVYLNESAAARLQALPGDRLDIEYYMLNPGGDLRTDLRTVTLAGVVRMTGAAADAGLTPEYPGISRARSMSDWDPPFPVDFKRITPADEKYWEEHGATPKAFIPLELGQRWWASEGESTARFGRLTSVRFPAQSARPLDAHFDDFVSSLMRRMTPELAGFAVRDLRGEALAAAGGTTDFGGLFIGFSMFLIAAAAMLVGLLFRLNVEQRGKQIGLLLAIGWNMADVRRLLIAEGAALAVCGAAIGAPGAVGYAWLMLAGLRTLWRSAVGTSQLFLHVGVADVAIGAIGGVLVALIAMAWAVRIVRRSSPAGLVSVGTRAWGASERGRDRKAGGWGAAPMWLPAAAAVGCVGASFGVEGTAKAGLFFGAGAAALSWCLVCFARRLKRADRAVASSTAIGLASLGVRHAARRPERTIATVSMLAAATFVVIAVAASRHVPEYRAGERASGHGGFALMGRSAAPLLHDPATEAGRERLELSAGADGPLSGAAIFSLRYRAGDDASCLNLFKPQSPAVLGVPASLVARGGFRFAATMAQSGGAWSERRASVSGQDHPPPAPPLQGGGLSHPASRRASHPGGRSSGPWRLLEQEFPDGAIPALGDANTVTWLLHLGLGEDFVMRGDDGREVRLRIVGTLAGSIFQSELLVNELNFLRAFPRTEGYREFLIETPEKDAGAVSDALERDLADYGMDVMRTREKLAAFAQVENTYLSTFQLLGGLGLLLGTLGVVALLLRNVFERRGEMALMAAVGLRRGDVARMVLAEVAYVIAAGVGIGAVCALLAVAPNAISSAREIPWPALTGLLALVIVVGVAASWMAFVAGTRGRLIDALRAG